MKKIIGALLLATVFMGCAGKPATEWVSDFDAAQAVAKEQKKSILLVFTGIEWDQVSAGVKESLIDTPEFIKAAGKKYELVQIDIPIEEGTVEAAELEKRYELANKYSLQTTPGFVLIDSEGNKYASISYSEELNTVETLTAKFAESEKEYKEIVSLKSKTDRAKGTAKVKLIDELYEKTPAEQRDSLLTYIAEVPTLDPENTTGLVGKYKLQQAYVDASGLMQAGDFAGVCELFKSTAEDPMVTGEDKQNAYYMEAYISFSSGISSLEEVLVMLENAVAAAPESAAATDIAYTIEQLKSSATETEGTQAPAVQGDAAAAN